MSPGRPLSAPAGVVLVNLVNASSLRLSAYPISNSRKNKLFSPINVAAESYGGT